MKPIKLNNLLIIPYGYPMDDLVKNSELVLEVFKNGKGLRVIKCRHDNIAKCLEDGLNAMR